MKKLAIILAIVTVAGTTATATVYREWADEFLGHIVDCKLSDEAVANNFCISSAQWGGSADGETSFPPWEFVGNQGANAAGRANAREKTMFRVREISSTKCQSYTVTVSRFRVTSPPAVGSSCNAVTGVFAGSVSQNWQTCSPFALADWLTTARLLPIHDFSTDTSLPGQNVGYRSVMITQNSVGTMTSGTSCYQIHWQ